MSNSDSEEGVARATQDGLLDLKTELLILIHHRYLWAEFVQQTWRKIKKQKINYCLGFGACLIVVFVVSVMTTLINYSPIIFLRLAELSAGETDITASPLDGINRINYTLAGNVLTDEGKKYSYHTPRYEQEVTIINFADCSQNTLGLSLQPYDTWPYIPFNDTQFDNSTENCLYDSTNCFYYYCNTARFNIKTKMFLIDSDKEDRMDLGRSWDLGKVPQGKLYIKKKVANQIGVAEGDVVYLDINGEDFFGPVYRETVGSDPTGPDGETVSLKHTWLPVVVDTIYSSSNGKYKNSQAAVIMEYEYFMQTLANYSNPYMGSSAGNLSALNLYHHAQSMVVNLAPPRTEAYTSSNFDVIQKNVVQFASKVIYLMGFNQLITDLPVIAELETTRFFGLFLGLILNIVIFVLLFLSICLIYSLLMINVETRTFELGVLRMLGTTRVGIICLILLQAFAYSLPSWALGLGIAQVFFYVVTLGVNMLTGVSIPWPLTTTAILAATGIEIFISIASSLVPIRTALGQTLSESLDVRHSKTKSVEISIERSEGSGMRWAIIVLGVLLTLFGFFVYYLVPLSLLSFNFALLLNIFFFLLLGMLLGLVLLSLNLAHLLERFLVSLLLFWDSSAIRTLVLKNLVAHKGRNRKTSIMYAVSLGFIIFISVSYSLTIDSFTYGLQQSSGCYLGVYTETGRYDDGTPQRFNKDVIYDLESALASSDLVESWTWVTASLKDAFPKAESTSISNTGRYFTDTNNIYGIAPNYYDVALKGFLKVNSRSDFAKDQSLSQALYTPEGDLTMLIGTTYKKSLGLDIDEDLLLTITADVQPYDDVYTSVHRAAAFVDISPGFIFSKFPAALGQDNLVSYTTYMQLTRGNITSVDDIPMRYLLIKLKGSQPPASSDVDDVIKLMNPIVNTQSDLTVYNYYDEISPIKVANQALSAFFTFTTAVAMLISFFSLMSSMYTNIFEQTKEIAVLRAVGVGKFFMYRLYLYESFILVLSSSLLGILIGVVVGYTQAIQRILFTQLPIPFVFPTELLITVIIASVVCSIIASINPIRLVVSKPIVQILRILT